MNQTPWVDGLTIGQALAETARRFPDRDALVFPRLDVRWTWRDLEGHSRTLARAFLGLGIEPGERIGVWATNWPQWVQAQYAAALAGAVLVNINPAYRAHEFAYVLGQADIAALLLTDSFKQSDYEAMLAEVAPELASAASGLAINSSRYPKLRHAFSIKETPKVPGVGPWSALLAEAEKVSDAALAERGAMLNAGDAANIQFTSGTTGAPKGATLSHRNILLNGYYVGERMRLTEVDRVCAPVPFYHCFGCVMGTLACLAHGAALVIPAESFDPVATLDAVEQERCTALYGVPTMFNAQLHDATFASRDLSSLRTGIMAGSPCPIELMKQVVDRMNLREVTIAYGLTEAAPVITQTGTDEPLDLRVSTVGRPIPGVEVRLVDPVSGKDVPEGEQGELWTRGHGVMLGYDKMPEATAAAISLDGWLRTGDLATRLPSGHYKITGRIKDMIIRGGENIYPREIEEFLLTHPAIRDAQVVGLPDEKFGEEVCAWIIVKEGASLTAAEVRDYCKGRIAHYKTPRYVEFVDAYPLTVSGKVQKFRLREQGVERFGLQIAAGIETA